MIKSLLAFFLTLLCTLSYNATASHIAGGEISYKWVGNSNHPHRYEVSLVLIRDSRSSAQAPTSPYIRYTSGCHSKDSISAVMQAGSGISVNQWAINNNVAGPFACVDAIASGVNPNLYKIHIYKATIDLPGVCSDWTFSYSICCRNPALANIVNPQNAFFYIDAILNNNNGSNSSPVFLDAPTKAFCNGGSFGLPTPLIWIQRSMEPDGDSLHYSFGQPMDNANKIVNFAAGYSRNQPIRTSNGINFLNTEKGILKFTPNTNWPEDNIVKFDVEEYRKDSLGGWKLIGRVSRETTVPIVTYCASMAGSGFSLDMNNPLLSQGSMSADSLTSLYGIDTALISKTDNISFVDSNGNLAYNLPIVDYNDFDSVIHLEFNSEFMCMSVSPDASEFRLIGPDGILRPVIGTYSLKCDTNALIQEETTNEFYLLLDKALDRTGYFVLQLKKGSDGDVLKNICNAEFKSGYTILIKVDQVVGMNRVKSPDSRLLIYPNPSNGSFTVEFKVQEFKPYRLKVINNVGKVLYSAEIQNEEEVIDIDLAGGYFILQTELGERREVSKILIVK